MRYGCRPIVLASLTAGCTAERSHTDRPASAASSTPTVVAGWESVTVRRDSGITPERLSTPAGPSAYDALLAIPDERNGPPVTLAPTDETDMSNYQSSGWWLGFSNVP